VDAATRARFEEWLRAMGIEGYRRVARQGPEGILVSKFEAGFAARLHDAVDRVPELFDDALVAKRCERVPTGTTRVEAWRLAVEGLLRDIGSERGLDATQRAEIQAGVDSVAALLDSVLWTTPVVGVHWQVSVAEREAFDDANRRMDDERGLFTRYYGEFEGLRVENHCPGAQVARRLFAQAWAASTAEP